MPTEGTGAKGMGKKIETVNIPVKLRVYCDICGALLTTSQDEVMDGKIYVDPCKCQFKVGYEAGKEDTE